MRALAGGEPAWDPDFNTADLPVILSIHSMIQRYGRYFWLNVINPMVAAESMVAAQPARCALSLLRRSVMILV